MGLWISNGRKRVSIPLMRTQKNKDKEKFTTSQTQKKILHQNLQ